MAAKLDHIEIAILESIARGGVTSVPGDAEDSGHTSWLLSEGYIEFENGELVVTGKGRAAITAGPKP